jgi:uncharacterized membrane protein YdjX (TVP38/TMEM64 family)
MTPQSRKLVVLAAVVLTVVAAGALLLRQIPESISAPLFILVVIVEVVVAPVPGGAIGYMGAARFGFETAWPLLYIGNVVGTTLVFWIARRFGTPIFEENVSEGTRRRYDGLLRGHVVFLWMVYAVPLIPVDVLSVLAGLSRIPTRKFLLIAYTGYVSYTGIVAFVGSYLAQFIGVAEAVSAIGGLFLVLVIVWVWHEQRAQARRDRSPAPGEGGGAGAE